MAAVAAARGETGKFPYYCDACVSRTVYLPRPSLACKVCDHHATAAQKREENRKARLRKKQRRQTRKANKAVEVHREQGAGCEDDRCAERRQEADKAVEVHQGAGCGDDGCAERRQEADRAVEVHQGAGCGDDGAAERSREADMAVEEHREEGAGDGWADLEPLFFDEAAAVAEHESRMLREHQREQQREQEEAHNRRMRIARAAALDRIREYDPKHGKNSKTYYTRLEYVGDITTFDHDEESPLGPMRYTEALIYAHGTVQGETEKKLVASYSPKLGPINKIRFSLDGNKRRFLPEDSANIFSIKIVSSDVGFPIDVYGTVIARDNIDLKCVYLFRRDRDHSQLILSKDESLILTGPKRALALESFMYFEFDLKIKCAGRQKDKKLSKGYTALNGLNYSWFEEVEVESTTLDTQLSKVMITYAVVHTAVEATFAIEVLQGRFYGEITACTAGIRDSIVLHDSKMVEAMTNSGKGIIQLSRNVVSVDMREKLMFTVVAWTGDGKTKSTTIRFTPGLSGGEEKEITCGSIKMCVKITWSIISCRV